MERKGQRTWSTEREDLTQSLREVIFETDNGWEYLILDKRHTFSDSRSTGKANRKKLRTAKTKRTC